MKKKRRWLKRLLLSVALLLVLLAGGVIALAYMSGGRPDWYRLRVLDEKAVKQNYDSAMVKLGTLQNWVQDQRNWPTQSSRPRVDTDPVAAPPATRTITLTEDELNALLTRERGKLLERYGHAIADPYLAIHDGHVVLAVTHKGTGRVISAHVAPQIDAQGLLTLLPDSLRAGRIPIPKSLWSGYTGKLVGILGPAIENVRNNVAVEGDGTWNESAVVSAMSRLVLNSINEKASDAVLFLPPDLNQLEKGYPVKLSKVVVDGETISLTATTLDGEEQKRLLLRLRAPLEENPAAPISANGAAQPTAQLP